MSFEQMLRERMQQEADAIELPERAPDQAIGQARTRRRRQIARTGVAGLAVVLAAAVAVPRIAGRDGDQGPVASGGGAGLVPTGPLDLDWRSAEDGLSNVRTGFQGDDGTVYALSTGPGARYGDDPEAHMPRALYRLTEDGSWEHVPLDGDRPQAVDVASGDGLLYAVSTGPGSGGGTTVRLSTSGDRGDTWSSQEMAAVEPPSTAVSWNSEWVTSVESNGSTTLAVTTVGFYPDMQELFPEMADDDSLSVETRDEGLVLVRWDAEGDEGDERNATPPTMPPPDAADPGGTDDEEERAEREQGALASGDAGGEVSGGEVNDGGEVIRTVTWAEIGVDGPEALNGRTQLFRWAGGTWEPVAGGAEALAGLGGADLQVAGDRFVASGWLPAEQRSAAFTSTDGTSWTPVQVSEEATVLSVGPALVQVPYDSTVLRVSGDAGMTWSEVDLTDFGVREGSFIGSYDAGPLGLALVVDHTDDPASPDLVVSGDLIDWTVTPLSDIVGLDNTTEVTPVVGEDRIVVSAVEASDGSAIPGSVTAVGTPVR